MSDASERRQYRHRQRGVQRSAAERRECPTTTATWTQAHSPAERSPQRGYEEMMDIAERHRSQRRGSAGHTHVIEQAASDQSKHPAHFTVPQPQPDQRAAGRDG